VFLRNSVEFRLALRAKIVGFGDEVKFVGSGFRL
jgi:hypothetical protein